MTNRECESLIIGHTYIHGLMVKGRKKVIHIEKECRILTKKLKIE